MRGVYQIRCVSNGNVYIGASGDVNRRWREHKSTLRRKTHGSSKLQGAWDVFGEANFVFELVEEVGEDGDLFAREAHHIERAEAKYNTASEEVSEGMPLLFNVKPPVNKGKNFFEYNGESHNVHEWARITGLSRQAIEDRLRDGLPLDAPKRRLPPSERMVTYNGRTLSLLEWAQATGIDVEILSRRIRRGWPVERALTTSPSIRSCRSRN